MSSHIKVLLWKNYLLWKRSMCCSILEIILPVLLCCFFYLFRSSLDSTTIKETSYLEPDFTTKPPTLYPYSIWGDYAYPDNVPPALKDDEKAQ
jgi:ATP-binding cassette subfamily A (ABC1) protein 3